MTKASPSHRLVADIGGTNARAAIATAGAVDLHRIMEREAHSADTVRDLFRQCMRDAGAGGPIEAALAVAGPVEGDRVTLTNGGWSFSAAQLKQTLGFASVTVVNDFVGIALGVPYLDAADRYAIGGGTADPQGPIAVLGPGTGLGTAGLAPSAEGALVVPGEGGHATVSPGNAEESGYIDFLRDDALRGDGERWHGHVSAERILSGPGMMHLARAIHHAAGVPSPIRTPEDVTRMANAGDALAVRTVQTFLAMLGAFAGNLALTFGATGGVYIGGGIVPRLKGLLAGSEFRARFEQKGRLTDYLRRVPTFLITHQEPALLGLAKMGGLAAGPMLQRPVLARGYRA